MAAPDIDVFRKEARTWLDANAELKRTGDEEEAWACGPDSVAVFHDLTEDEERELHAAASAWQQRKFDAGWAALTWPERYGGRSLSSEHERAFRAEESRYETPALHETFSVTVHLMAPTVAALGNEEQKAELVRPFLRTDVLCCQLFSEPGAGSDLASVACRAVRDGDEWVVDGQKVWTSGARFSAYGLLIARTDPSAPKHKGMTAFLVPMDRPGIEVRPIRQMSGGASFNEVFFSEARVPDRLRIGAEGQGWEVALTTLGFERGASGGGGAGVGGSYKRVLALARHLGLTDDPIVRQDLAGMYTRSRIAQVTGQRVQGASKAGQPPGPEGSIGKLFWTESMTFTSDVVSRLLGPRLVADTGEWGTWCWSEHVLGAPGYRIAGGSDEVQRNIIGERVLGLPREPRP